MRGRLTWFAALGAMLVASSAWAESPSAELSDVEECGYNRSYVGLAGAVTLPQGGSRMHRVGGATLRGGYYIDEFLAVEGETAWLENFAGLAVDVLWHWWGYERFDPFFTVGARGWIGARGQVGPKAGVGAFYHLTDEWSFRVDADATLGLDTDVEVDYSLSVGLQYSF